MFDTKLSLQYVIEFWRKEVQSESVLRQKMAEMVLQNVPEGHVLHGDELTLGDVEANEELVDQLMMAVVPSSARDRDLIAGFVPFHNMPIFATQAFMELRYAPDSLAEETHSNFDVQKTMTAYAFILRNLYGADVEINHDYLIETLHPDTGLSRYYRVQMDTQFVEVEVIGAKPQLTEEQIQTLVADPADLALYEELLPPQLFRFKGLSLARAVDVTPSEAISRMKQDLLLQDALVSEERLDAIERRLRSVLGKKEVRLGVIALDRCDRGNVTGAREIGRSILLHNGMPQCDAPEKTVYYRVFMEGRSLVVNGLSTADSPSGFTQAVVAEGIESLYLAPLVHDGNVMGMIEIGSPVDGCLRPSMITMLDEIAELFSTALKRSLDEQEDRVQSLIKKQFTAIHPVVEWKFRRVALDNLGSGAVAMPGIRFAQVHSLFGTSDIRGSSTIRGEAIQQDLAEQMGLALAAIIAASTVRPRPSLDELGYRISNHIEKVLDHVNSGDELTYTSFLHDEVEPLFEEFRTWSEDVSHAVDRYYDALDESHGLLYRKRKDFDESVRIINDVIGAYMHQRQVEAQEMTPHYFEMYHTDGVEYTMYAGSSLLNGAHFGEMDLKNLRLWQLITMAGIAAESRRILPELPIPLELAQLVLVQSSPVDIHFRTDEKKFDVEGAYNIRYEIVKKRIDKATIKGTGERLTQPGTVAIVFTQKSEEEEYKRYLKYLFAAGYFEGRIEKLDLEPLPGVSGLKAIRVTVAEHGPGEGPFPIPDPAAKRSERTEQQGAGDGSSVEVAG